MRTTTDVEAVRRSPVAYIALFLAAAAFVLVAIAFAAKVTETDPAGPKLMSADDAAKSGNPAIELGEMYIRGDLAVGSGATVSAINRGAAPHNLTVGNGPATPDLNPNRAAELDLAPLPDGTYTVYCSIDGHRAAGMEAELKVGS
jgi:plastocyanin